MPAWSPGVCWCAVPDWSYHPLLKPLTAWLPAATRRTLALRGLQAVTAVPGGFLLVDFLGRMSPDRSLETSPYATPLASPIGLGGGVDPDALAIGALGRLGFGFIEVGPYALGTDDHQRSVRAPLTAGFEPHRLGARLRCRPRHSSVWLRLALVERDAGAVLNVERLLESVNGAIDVVTVSILETETAASRNTDTSGTWRRLLRVCREHGVSTILADYPRASPLSAIQPALEAGAGGLVLRSPIEQSDSIDMRTTLQELRSAVPSPGLIVVAGGARSPRDILEAFDAGADLVAVDQGLIEAGPGLAKRSNEALVVMRNRAASRNAAQGPPPASATARGSAWTWLFLLGLGMLTAGAIIFWVGLTRVLLPYDEAFLGIAREDLTSINPRLIGFMRHDRITLAGTLMSIGILYASLAWNGVRNGQRWARDAVLGSGVVGFASLFLFLGFHYVDPLHIVLSGGLFPLFLLGVLVPMRSRPPARLDLDNDSSGRLSLFGQLLLIGLAAGLIGAGLTITTVGVTRVFVFSDLQYLQTTAAAIGGANAHLLPLIAHDRAGFGGALASDGIVVLLVSLWGLRRGERWVWWTLLSAGLTGLGCGVYAHVAVGYLEFGHLLPLALSAVVFIAALSLTAPFLLTRRPSSL